MCGICGIIGESPCNSIENMVSAMHHRGPDDHGVFRDNNIALGMTRLSIIDISNNGHQPMSNNDGSIWIVYNGEMFNFKSERENLVKHGYKFKSMTDTEVIIHMYELYGDDFLTRIRGMFALAIYDRRKGSGKERLILARDQIGIKPLIYTHTGSKLIFASEIKSLVASGLVKREVDYESLRLLLTYGSISQPATIIKDVRMLLPGHKLIIENGQEKISKYWCLGIDRYNDLKLKEYGELVEIVKSKLIESVEMQMVSDVPIGAFLSGGIDSSLLVALMSQLSSNKVKTFSVGFEAEGTDMDETSSAERIAKFIGTDHKKVIVTGNEVRDKIMDIASALDQPTVDGVNSYFVSKAASREVAVAISGTGGDEIFAGYPWFINMVKFDKNDKQMSLESLILKVLSEVSRRSIFDRLLESKYGHRVEFFRGRCGFLSRYARQYCIFGPLATAKVLSPSLKRLVHVGRESSMDIKYSDELSFGNVTQRVSGLCLRGYTQNQLLRDIDAVSMAHSLEVRVPYLDIDLIDMVLSLPDSCKLNDFSNIQSKYVNTYRDSGSKKILFDIGKGVLPEDLDIQQKHGFSMPFAEWMKGSLRDILEDTLSHETIKNRGLFNEEEIRILKTDFFSGSVGWAKPWLIMMLELWCREVIDL